MKVIQLINPPTDASKKVCCLMLNVQNVDRFLLAHFQWKECRLQTSSLLIGELLTYYFWVCPTWTNLCWLTSSGSNMSMSVLWKNGNWIGFILLEPETNNFLSVITCLAHFSMYSQYVYVSAHILHCPQVQETTFVFLVFNKWQWFSEHLLKVFLLLCLPLFSLLLVFLGFAHFLLSVPHPFMLSPSLWSQT